MRALHPDDVELVRPHLRPGEAIVWGARPSLFGLAPIVASAVASIVGIVVPIAIGLEDSPAASILASTTFLLAFAGLAAGVVRRFVHLRFTVFVITRERFYSVTSFFTTTVRSVPLSRVTLVTLHQGFIPRLFDLWSARVTAYGEAGATLDIPAIRDGEGLLEQASAGLDRGANAAWILRGD